MAEQINEAYIGSGIVYINGRDVGNCSNVNFAIEQETQTQRNYRGGGGNFASVTTVSAVNLSMELANFSNANLALALRGVVESVAAGQVADESVVAVAGGLAETSKMIDLSDTANTVTVKDETDQTTYVAGTDYEVTAAGLKILSGGNITDGETLKVSYDNQGTNVLQALIDSGQEVRVVLDGINDATGKPVTVKVHRWKPSPTSGLGLISDSFATFTIEGEVLADETIQAAGKSKFFTRAAAAA
ncbi:phage tail tube protein [Marinobacter nauticus]|uniref:phage tail tube protein n=1 Tax=Marinobacter nauticus TaxID=2743 RepID=UPI000EB43EAE|nr:hypothetical protein [Marinobacter nauticus]MEC7815843.1 hypothetical protein [Pseudomonadota bacterium]RKR79619.1 hypothetical protein C7436_1070 [Marinobacter nauticus]